MVVWRRIYNSQFSERSPSLSIEPGLRVNPRTRGEAPPVSAQISLARELGMREVRQEGLRSGAPLKEPRYLGPSG